MASVVVVAIILIAKHDAPGTASRPTWYASIVDAVLALPNWNLR
jgi:hypothetical protein